MWHFNRALNMKMLSTVMFLIAMGCAHKSVGDFDQNLNSQQENIPICDFDGTIVDSFIDNFNESNLGSMVNKTSDSILITDNNISIYGKFFDCYSLGATIVIKGFKPNSESELFRKVVDIVSELNSGIVDPITLESSIKNNKFEKIDGVYIVHANELALSTFHFLIDSETSNLSINYKIH